MKKWIIIDDCLSSKSAIFEHITAATSAAEAEAAARTEWDRMSAADQAARDAFFVGLCEITPEIESGDACYADTMSEIVAIK